MISEELARLDAAYAAVKEVYGFEELNNRSLLGSWMHDLYGWDTLVSYVDMMGERVTVSRKEIGRLSDLELVDHIKAKLEVCLIEFSGMILENIEKLRGKK